MPQYEDIRVSDEFIDLCESQLSLLFQNFLVQESAIYLTKNYHQEPKLIPVVVYPNSSPISKQNLLPSFFDTVVDEKVSYVLDDVIEEELLTDKQERKRINDTSPNQLVLPLLYQDMVFGLLATTRRSESWQSHEIIEIKEVAQTIAIARLLEQKQQHLETKYTQIQKLQQLKDEHLDDFLHQLKNPLTAIGTFAKVLLRKIVPEDSNYQTSESIIRQGDRLKELINDFNQQWQKQDYQTYTLADSQSTSFFLTENVESLTPTNTIEVVTPIIETIKTIASEKNITVYDRIKPNLFPVMSNAKALTEIVYNLMENAVKYTPKNGSILIEINNDRDHSPQITVADTGYGIPPEDQSKIFDRHYRGQQKYSDIDGSGLGLAIVKQLCEQINLEINVDSPYRWLDNQEKNGTKFTLSFPPNYSP